METLNHKFVNAIPDLLEDGFIYVSVERGLATHLCVCGCKNEVITPFSPTDWELRFYGNTVSLYPSIGNWEFDCQSHYFITKNQIHWSGKWDEKEIRASRENDKNLKREFFASEIVALQRPVVKQVDYHSPFFWKKIKIFFGFKK